MDKFVKRRVISVPFDDNRCVTLDEDADESEPIKLPQNRRSQRAHFRKFGQPPPTDRTWKDLQFRSAGVRRPLPQPLRKRLSNLGGRFFSARSDTGRRDFSGFGG